MSRIMLLEDDSSLVDGLRYSLGKNGFEVSVAGTVGDALSLLKNTDAYDLLILDVALPDGTGFEVCEKVRKRGSSVPILFLTAADEEVQVIRGLDSGGDDYVTKPFRIGELCSRIRALLRRNGISKQGSGDILECGDLRFDFPGNRVWLREESLELTAGEYRLLSLLVRNANRIVTRSRILEELWDKDGEFVDDNTISVYIRRLREKIEDAPSSPEHLITVRGFGYQWKEAGE